MNLIDYIRPELFIVAIVCFFIGVGLKKTELITDKQIPLVLGAVSVILCSIYIAATSVLTSYQAWLTALFTALTQGVLMAGFSTYVHQLIKQLRKTEE